PDFRSAAYRSLTSVLKLSAIPAQDDRFWSWPVPWTGSSGSARTSSTAAACSSKPSESTRAARTTYRPYADATKVPAAYGSVPERRDFTGFFVGGDSSINDDIGVGHASGRPILIVEDRSGPSRPTSKI